MATNTNLSFEIARELIFGKKVLCPACRKAELKARYPHKNTRTEFKCLSCGEIFRAEKLI